MYLTVELKLPLPLKKKYAIKANMANVWKKCGYFSQQPCDFSKEKDNLPENSIFLHKSSLMFYTRTIRNYTVATTTYWDKLISVSTVLKIWLATFARRMRLRSIGLGITPSEVNS